MSYIRPSRCTWKKIVDDKGEKMLVFKNTCKPNHFVDVYKQTYNFKAGKDWIVDLVTPSVGMTLKISKNKDEAVKFARNYMRRHKRG